MSIIRTWRYTALEILTMAFPKGIKLQTGKQVDHVVSEEDLKANPGMEKDVKVGDVIQIPEFVQSTVDKALGKYSVTIGGVRGITKPDRKIIVDATKPVKVTIGQNEATLEVVEPETSEK